MFEENEIIITAILIVKDDMVAEFKKSMRNLVALTKQERGCKEFKIIQSERNLDEYVLWEHFESEVAFNMHMQMPYTKEFFAKEFVLSTVPIRGHWSC
jgi:quinol monooxygenase YgiN